LSSSRRSTTPRPMPDAGGWLAGGLGAADEAYVPPPVTRATGDEEPADDPSVPFVAISAGVQKSWDVFIEVECFTGDVVLRAAAIK